MKRYNISAWGDGDFGLDVDEYETGEWVRFNDVSAALARAEMLAVWAVRHSVGVGLPEEGLEFWLDPDDQYSLRSIKFDGTDAGILAALRRAIEGKK